MAEERKDQGRTFADRVGDKVMGSVGDSCPVDDRPAVGRTEASARVQVGNDPAGARTGLEGDRIDDARFQAAPTRDRAPGYRAAAFGASSERSVASLLRDLSREMATLMRMEVALAKAEMREKSAIMAKNAVAAAIGGVLALAGLVVLLGALVAALSAVFDVMGVSARVYSWLSPLIVAAVVFGVSYFLIKRSVDSFKATKLMPERTAESLRETTEWVKEKVA